MTDIVPNVQGQILIGNDYTSVYQPNYYVLEGSSVALSENGEIAVVGGPGDNNFVGAIWIFTRSGNSWTASSRLTPNDTDGSPGPVGSGTSVGTSVAVNANGTIVFTGGPGDDSVGAFYCYNYEGDPLIWVQRGINYQGSGGTKGSMFGHSLDLYSAGAVSSVTLAVGGYEDESLLGAVWVFECLYCSCTLSGSKLVGTGSQGSTVFQGFSVAIRNNTILSGGTMDNNGVGAVWVFTRPSSSASWTQNGSKLIGTECSSCNFGSSVALDSAAVTAAIGGNMDDGSAGAVWMFTCAGTHGQWTQQAKLVPSDAMAQAGVGTSVALSASGNLLLVGGPADQGGRAGAGWFYLRTNGSWVQYGRPIVTSTYPIELGSSVALSGDGRTALIGAPSGDVTISGSAYIYTVAVPSLTPTALPTLVPSSPSLGPTPSPTSVISVSTLSASNNTSLYIGIGVAVAVLGLCAMLATLLLRWRRKKDASATFMELSLIYADKGLAATATGGREDHISQPVRRVQWSDVTVDVSAGALLGRGSFGVVVLSSWRDPEVQLVRKAAVKVVTEADTTSPDGLLAMRRRMYHEAMVQLCAEDSGDHVVKIFGICDGALPDKLCDLFNLRRGLRGIGIVMQYAAGGDLDHWLHGQGGASPSPHLSAEQKFYLAQELACGLVELHAYGIVHGDIKPTNVLLDGSGPRPKVRYSDFGLASIRERERGELGHSTLLLTANTTGTPVYCAPEMFINPALYLNSVSIHPLSPRPPQSPRAVPNETSLEVKYGEPGSPFLGADKVDRASDTGSALVAQASRKTDLYAFSILLWELFTQRRPFVEIKTQQELGVWLHAGGRPPLSALPSDTPPDIALIIENGWSPQRSERRPASECYAVLRRHFEIASTASYDIFFSHAWASKPFLAHVYAALAQLRYRVWYDQNDMGSDLKQSMSSGIANSTVVLVCLNQTYQQSANCMYELREARTMGKRVVTAVIESDVFSWASPEIRELCDIHGTLFADLSAVNTAGWDSEEGVGEEAYKAFREGLKPLLKILNEAQCFPSYSLDQ